MNDEITRLRAERDAAYKRGQEDMRSEVARVVGDYPTKDPIVSRIYSELSNLPIKEHPDV